ncbi:MAG: hypothetical protein ACRD44_05795 [Bryobacteraceae bacterium]
MTGQHEKTDAHVPALVKGLVALVVVTGISAGAMVLMFNYLAHRDRLMTVPPEMATGRVIPPAPRLQVNPSIDLDRMLALEEQMLSTYGWVDRKAGVVRIPIERAMELLAERESRK